MSVEPAIPPHLICPRTRPNRMPVGFEAPYPAWMARYEEGSAPLVMAYFGAQQLALLPPDALAPIRAMLQSQTAPAYWLEAQCHDGAGFDTRVIIAYWRNAETFADWRRASGFNSWWADQARETEPLGRFLEVVAPPMNRLEVAYSPPHRPEGAAHPAKPREHVAGRGTRLWGSARDRIPASQTDPMEGDAGPLTQCVRVPVCASSPGATSA